jgi:hypothetical protein
LTQIKGTPKPDAAVALMTSHPLEDSAASSASTLIGAAAASRVR